MNWFKKAAFQSTLAIAFMLTSVSGCSRTARIELGKLENPSPVPMLDSNRETIVTITFLIKTKNDSGEEAFKLMFATGVAVGPNHVLSSILPFTSMVSMESIRIIRFDLVKNGILYKSKVVSIKTNRKRSLALLETKVPLKEWVWIDKGVTPKEGDRIYTIDVHHVQGGQTLPSAIHLGSVAFIQKLEGASISPFFAEVTVTSTSYGGGIFDSRDGSFLGIIVEPILGPSASSGVNGNAFPVSDIAPFLKANGVKLQTR